jgi:hypothetical protein
MLLSLSSILCYLLVFCGLLCLSSFTDVLFMVICCSMLLLCWSELMFWTQLPVTNCFRYISIWICSFLTNGICHIHFHFWHSCFCFRSTKKYKSKNRIGVFGSCSLPLRQAGCPSSEIEPLELAGDKLFFFSLFLSIIIMLWALSTGSTAAATELYIRILIKIFIQE